MTTQENQMSGPITLKIKGQDGDVMSFRIWRNMQLKKLMCFYCDHKSMDLSFTCFCSGSRLLSGEESPDELEMKDEDEICAFDCSVRQSMRSKLECSSPLDPVDVHDNEISRAYTFDELEDRTTNGFAQADLFPIDIQTMSFLKASKNYVEVVKATNEALQEAKIGAEKKIAERDVVITRMRLENRQLQLANDTLSRRHSSQAFELATIKRVLFMAKEGIARVRKQLKDNKRDGSFDDKGSHKRARLDRVNSAEHCPVGGTCTVNQDAVESKVMVAEQARKPKSLTSSEKIDIQVLLNDESEPPVSFKIKRSMPMKKLMHAYCNRQQIDIRNTFFFSDSKLILMEDTPYELQMNDGDKIHAHQLLQTNNQDSVFQDS